MDKKKFLCILIVIIILVIGLYQFAYLPYQEEQAKINYNNGLINASNIEDDNSTEDQYNFDDTEDMNEILTEVNKMYDEIEPQIKEEKDILNNTLQYSNNNETMKKYLELQIKRLETSEHVINNTVTTFNEVGDAVNNGDELLALALYSRLEKETPQDINELKNVYDEIKIFLNDNPDLDSDLHELDLKEDFYGVYNDTDLNFTI